MTAAEGPSRPVLGLAPSRLCYGARRVTAGSSCTDVSESELMLMPGGVERWRPPPRALDPWLVLRLTGYRRPEAVTPVIAAAARRVAARADRLAAPVAYLRVVRVEGTGENGAHLAEGVRFSGRGVGALLSRCPLAVAFALTIGPALETEVAGLGDEREPLDAYLLDTAGWAALEVAARELRQALRVRLRGGRITHRLAPGYLDWPIEEQARLLALLDEEPPLVRLSPFGVLAPFKSITGLFGVRPPGVL